MRAAVSESEDRAAARVAAEAGLVERPAEVAAESRMAAEAQEVWRRVYSRLIPDPMEGHHLLAVSSPRPGEGKTTVAMGLASTLADDLDRRILLVDCNLSNHGLSRSVQQEDARGLSDYLGGDQPFGVVLHRTAVGNLWVVPAGSPVPNPSRLFRSSAMVRFLEEAGRRFEIVLLDLPSLLAASDSRLIAAHADSLLLVVRTGVSTARDVSRALEAVPEGVRRGVVLNGFHTAIPRALRRFLLPGEEEGLGS